MYDATGENVCFERGAEVRICHNRRDVGLTFACDDQPGACQYAVLPRSLMLTFETDSHRGVA